ncbi:MAG: hypothetical protein AB8I80_16450, partial [Anaerolineae bacterium]
MTGKAQHPERRATEQRSTRSTPDLQRENETEQADLARLQRIVADPGAAGLGDVQKLQGAYGNRAVTTLLAGTPQRASAIQARLTVGPVGDHYEQEADRIAEQALRAPVPAVPGRPSSQPGAENAQRAAGTEGQLQAQPLATTVTPLVQRQEDEEEIQTKPLVQRQEEEEELQAKPLLQRQEEEEELQAKPLVQRQEDEEELQTKPLVQRQEEEEELQAK